MDVAEGADGGFRLGEEGDEISIAQVLAEADQEEKAIAAMRACTVPPVKIGGNGVVMALDRCIPGLVATGELTKDQGERALAIYGQVKARHSRSMVEAAAEALADEDVLAQLAAQAAEAKRQKLLQIDAQKRAIVKMASYNGGSGKDPGAAAIALLVRDEKAAYPNYEYRHQFHRAEAHAELTDLLQRHSRNTLGVVRDKAGLVDLVREAFGEATGNANAREFAEAWGRAAETLRQKFNAAGGTIGKLENWGLPQSHDSLAVAKAGFPAWRDFIEPLLDRPRMIDEATGLPFDDAALDRALRGVFDNIATDGWAGRTPGGIVGVGKLASQRSDERFLMFDGADKWLAYQEMFGGPGTPFDVMMGHVDHMARDVALLEILGPNPAATMRWLKDGLEKGASLSAEAKARDAANASTAALDRIYNEITMKNARPESRAIALGFSALRAWQTTTKLGSATISAIGDIGNQTLTRAYNGLPVTPMLWSYAKLLNPASKSDRAIAMRSGLTADDAAQMVGATNRITGQELTGEVFRRMAELTLRLSGLNAVTRAGRWAFGMDSIAALTSESVKGWGALGPAFRGMFERYGLGEADWDAIRATPLTMEKGVPWLKPLDIEQPDLRSRVVEMILSETDMAVPTPGLRIRAATSGALAKGTWLGEIGRTAFQFKGFGISMLLTNWQRMMANGRISGRVGYAVGFTGLLTLLGVASIQMRELVKGRDPRPMEDPGLWTQAALQGGGFGIYGDFIKNSQNRFGGGVADTLQGPAWSTANQLGRIVLGDSQAALAGDPTNPGREIVKLLKQETPGGSLWYARLAYERLLLDQLQAWGDPNHASAWSRMERKAREQGQDYWWAPGETAPDRAPDLEAAFEPAPTN